MTKTYVSVTQTLLHSRVLNVKFRSRSNRCSILKLEIFEFIFDTVTIGLDILYMLYIFEYVNFS